MSADLHARLLDAAVASTRAGTPFADVVREVIAAAAAEVPSPVWDDLAATDTAIDVAGARPWLLRQFEERPLPDGLSSLWFGLYVVRSSSPGRLDAMVGLSGGPGLPEPGWTSNRTWDAAGYAPAPGLRALLPLTPTEEVDVRGLVAGPVVFAYSLGLVAAVLDAATAARILDGRPPLRVIVGVPDGQAVDLGVLTADGLDRSSAARVEPAQADAPPA